MDLINYWDERHLKEQGRIYWRHHFPRRFALLKVIKPIKNNFKTLLEIGSGNGRWCNLFTKKGYTTAGIDSSSIAVEIAKRKHSQLSFQVMDATKIKFPAESFDLVLSVSCLQCIPYPKQKKVAKEMTRIAKKYILIQELAQTGTATHVFGNTEEGWKAIFPNFRLISKKESPKNHITLLFERER